MAQLEADRCPTRPVWPDGYMIMQSLAIYINYNLPSSIKMTKLEQSLTNTQ